MYRRAFLATLAGIPFLAGCTATGRDTVELQITASDGWHVQVHHTDYQATVATKDAYSGTGDETLALERELDVMIIIAKSKATSDQAEPLTLRVVESAGEVERVTLENGQTVQLNCGDIEGDFACERL